MAGSSLRPSRTGGLLAPLAIGLVVVPALLVTAALEISQEFGRAGELRAAVHRSYEQRLQMQTVLSLVQDAETGKRGYVITGQSSFLEPYTKAVQALEPQLRRLRALQELEGGASSADVRDLDQLESQIDAELKHFRAVIETYDTRGAAAAEAMVAHGVGNQLLEDIRGRIDRLSAAKRQALAARIAADAETTRNVERNTLILFLVQGLLLLGAFARIVQQGWGRQRLHQKVEANAARMTAIFESAQDGLLTFNRSGTVESINRAGQAMFGYGPTETLGRDAALLLDIPDAGEVFLDRLVGGQGLGQGLTREMVARRKDGSTFPAEVSLGRFDLPNGAHVVAAVRDMSERRRVEQMKSEFVATVSHELRTPLTSIAGALGLLVGGAGGEFPERAARLVGIAHANCQRLVRLINDILDIEKIQSGQLTFEASPLDLTELSRSATESMQGLATDQGVVLEISTVAPAMVRGDADRLTQVVANLLSNAVKFSPRGGTVEISVASRDLGRHRLSVRDYGAGVPEAFRERIFSKFAQADGSDTRQLGGTGLGLAICREIVERHGGRISFDSAPGQGATFHVDLPALSAERVGQSGARILICEDDPDSARMLADLGADIGLTADIVGTLADAEQALLGPLPYSTLLLDLRLPDGHGLVLLKRLRERPETRTLPVLIVSAEAGSPPKSLNVLDWLQKPVDIPRLQDALAHVRRGEQDRILVLHVEDDPDVRQIVAAALSDHCDVIAADSLKSARRMLKEARPQLAILDVALGDESGLDLLIDLRKRTGAIVPVIVFSAQSIEDEHVMASVDAVLTKSRTTLVELSDRVMLLAAHSKARQDAE